MKKKNNTGDNVSQDRPLKNTDYYNYVVAFIDVLGQKDAFKPLEEFGIITNENKEELKAILKEVHLRTTYYVKTLRYFFKHFFSLFLKDRPIPASVPADKIAIFREMRKANLKYKSFSDCMQIFSSLKTKKYHCHAINAVYAMLMSCGGLLLSSLAEKQIVRAGIDVGIGVEIDENELYGPALFRAYNLESEVAQYPRIIVGDTLVNYLQNLSNRIPQMEKQTREDIELCKSIADHCLKMLAVDVDGYVILDYLGEASAVGLKVAFGSALQKNYNLAFDFIKKEYEKCVRTRDTKVSYRYYLLAQYFLKNKDHIRS